MRSGEDDEDGRTTLREGERRDGVLGEDVVRVFLGDEFPAGEEEKGEELLSTKDNLLPFET